MRLLAALLLVAVPAAAHAASFGMALKQKVGTEYRDFNTTELKEFFNSTSCECHRPFAVQLTLPGGFPGLSGDDNVEIWVGSNCATFDTERKTRCLQIPADLKLNAFSAGKTITVEIDAAALMFPDSGGNCAVRSGNNTVWALVDDGANQSYEISSSMTPAISYDTAPPPALTNLKASPGEGAISVSWDLPTTGSEDNRYIQIFCASSLDFSPLLAKPASKPEFTRPEDVTDCQETPSSADAGPRDAGVADAGVGDAGVPDAAIPGSDAALPTKLPADNSTAFNSLDPAYVCSGSISGSATSDRISLSGVTFADGEKILTKVVVVDQARNYQVLTGPTSDLPVDVRDGWETYHDKGGDADGGFCFVATAAYGDYDHPYVRVLRAFRDGTLAQSEAGRSFIRWYYAHSPPWAAWLRAHPFWRVMAAVGLFPVVALAWIWNGVGLGGFLLGAALIVVWRRRRRRRLALAAATVLALLAAGRPASAQLYLEEGAVEEHGPPRSHWAFELKLGPYFPDVDGESGLDGKPFERVFGSGNNVLFQAELQRFFFYPAGELGLAASMGYMSDKAKSFKQDAAGNVTDVRSADDTEFKMVPLALSVVYRFTLISDRTVVPLVPYAKLGLSYYVWQMTKGDGDLSELDGNKARGGTLGWQGTLGVAVRADAFDKEAARSLSSDLGVEHAGFFFEFTYADVSGLGMSKRLHLGDLTWAAGVNFEF